jgi:hypothetical protein
MAAIPMMAARTVQPGRRTTSLEHEQDEEDHDNGDDDEAAYAAQTHCGGMAACERVCFRGASLRADVHFIWSSFLLMSIMRK